MPSDSLWVQYSLIGILILAAGAIAAAFYRLWKDLLNWFELQDGKREAEREKQRSWQADQDRIRDLRWQEFLKSMQDEWIQQDGRHSDVLKGVGDKVDMLISVMNSHDVWARAKGRS